MSPTVMTRSPLFLMGRLRMSDGSSTTPGTFTANWLPPDLRFPAGTSWLLRLMTWASSPVVTL